MPSFEDDEVENLDERSFDDLENTVDRLSRDGHAPVPPELREPGVAAGSRSEAEFEGAVRAAIDGLPVDVQRKLEQVVITVSDDGHARHAYGMYIPGSGGEDGYRWWFFGIGRRATPPQIVIYRDTLERDFGSDASRLKAQIIQTVRHEVGHALGFDEAGVRGLGL